MKKEDIKDLILLIIGLVTIALIFMFATGTASKSNASSNKAAAAIVDTVSVRDSVDSGAFPDPCALREVVCTWVEQLEDSEGVAPQPPQVFEISAYSEFDSCHYEGCLMTNGLPAQIGYVACPRDVPLGTKIKIETLGTFECGDRTAKWVDGRYDVFLGYGQEAYKEAINFGIKLLSVIEL